MNNKAGMNGESVANKASLERERKKREGCNPLEKLQEKRGCDPCERLRELRRMQP